MCDYSLHHVGSRSAKVNDKLVTTELARASTRGFAAVGEQGFKLVIHDAPPKVAVCLLPGTELAFDDCVQYDRAFSLLGTARVKHKLARFRQIDTGDPYVHHDALEFPDGQIVKLTRLVGGQTARILQLPAATSHHEHGESRRVVRQSEPRLTMNRIPFRPGIAAFLLPSQGTVMLWQACRDVAVEFSDSLAQAFRRLKTPHKRPRVLRAALPAGTGSMGMEASFVIDVTQPSAPPAQKSETNIKAKTVA